MRALTDFLNHGTLPFVGRQTEVERLLSFWRTMLQGKGLRTALVTGEGGIGKSRLLEETYPFIARAGGVVIPIKLYRGAVASLAPLLRQSIGTVSESARLPRADIGESLTSIIDALRRISHVRPTLLVIEDVDKINHDSIQELGLLLDAISHETISVICVSRPMQTPVRGVMEPYLVDEIALSGLTEEDVGELWNRLLHLPPDPAIASTIQRTTLGSPLAIRSALRRALKSEAIVCDPITGSWTLAIDLTSFTKTLERNVHLLSEGMAAHLTAAEKNAAERLACLGEAFAMETARTVVADADRMIETLMFKGIVVTAGTTVAPLPTSASRWAAIAFTHTFLHNSLVGSAGLSIDQLLHIVAEGLPLYSTLPFTLLADHRQELHATPRLVKTVIERSLEMALALDRGPDRELGMQTWKAATALTTSYSDRWTPEERRHLQVRLLYAQLRLIRGTGSNEAVQSAVDTLLNLTEGADSGELLEYRLMVLAWPLKMDTDGDYSDIRTAWEEAEAIVRRHPGLARSRAYGLFLHGVADIAHAIGDRSFLRRIERIHDATTACQDLHPTVRDLYRKAIAPYFLDLFDTPDELNERTGAMVELEKTIFDREKTFALLKISFLESTGRTMEGLTACRETLPHLRNSYARRNYVRCAVYRICLKVPTGYDPAEAEAELDRLLVEHGSEISHRYGIHIAIHLATAGILSGSAQWARGAVRKLLDDDSPLAPEIRLLLRAENGTSAPMAGDEGADHPLWALATAIHHRDGRNDELRTLIEQALPKTILSLRDLLRIHAVAALSNGIMRDGTTIPVEPLRRAIESGLEWAAERRLRIYVRSLIEIGRDCLGEEEVAKWERRTDESGRPETQRAEGDTESLSISMLGKITVCKTDGEEVLIRGLRQKTLLGLMVADMMLDRPLSHGEFCRIAGAGVDDPEYARKMMNGTVWRLRDLLGHEAIVTQQDTPRLNLDLVRVDLLEARRLLREAADAMRSRSVIRLAPLLLEACDLTCGNVPFPGLYEEFFEAAREDFEFELRSTIIGAAQRLSSEGDPGSAEELLRRCFEMMPEDEEIADLLCRTLIQLGKRMEAKRVRMRTEEVAESA